MPLIDKKKKKQKQAAAADTRLTAVPSSILTAAANRQTVADHFQATEIMVGNDPEGPLEAIETSDVRDDDRGKSYDEMFS